MPAAIAHRAFALRLKGKDCPLGVLLGTEGPDPFMAYGMNPFRKKKDKDAVNPLGSLMHNTRLALVYAPMLSYAASFPEGKTRALLLDYMEGLLYHFILDRRVHPYVFYRTGFDEIRGHRRVLPRGLRVDPRPRGGRERALAPPQRPRLARDRR